MWIIKNRVVFYAVSAAILVAAVVAVAVWGLKFSIDFTGGTIVEVSYTNETSQEQVETRLSEAGLEGYSVRGTDNGGFLVRTKPLSEEERQATVAALDDGSMTLGQFNSIGPTLGDELRYKAGLSVLFVVLSIVIYVAIAFRHVSKPISSWTYGFITIAAFVHDVLVPVGLFAVLGHFAGYEVDTLFVTAILVVLGYSINDTVVVFDRVRENLRVREEKKTTESFEHVVGQSLKETVVRSLNTSATTLTALIVLYFVGGKATELFALALIAGVVAGTYSSIFLAAPLLVTIESWKSRKSVE